MKEGNSRIFEGNFVTLLLVLNTNSCNPTIQKLSPPNTISIESLGTIQAVFANWTPFPEKRDFGLLIYTQLTKEENAK